MLKYTAAELMRQLEREGLGFRTFSLVHEGNYTVEDADWNYKDVPHLHHIHALVEAHPAAVDDKFIATMNLQKVLGLRLPLTVFNYESGTNERSRVGSSVHGITPTLTPIPSPSRRGRARGSNAHRACSQKTPLHRNML